MLCLEGSGAGELVKLAYQFLILTAARTGEDLDATWREVDLERAIWTVPAERMKMRKEHRVPLSAPVVAALYRTREAASGSEHIFP